MIKEYDIDLLLTNDGLVNITKIANHFGKIVQKWKKTDATQAFLAKYAEMNPHIPNGGIQVFVGGKALAQGTYVTEEIAVEFMRWISVDFAVWGAMQLRTLLKKGTVALKPKIPDFANPAIAARAWAEEWERAETLRLEKEEALKDLRAKDLLIEAIKPKADFFSELENQDDEIRVRDVFKIFYDKTGLGVNKFYEILREKGVLVSNNLPSQTSLDRGYFKRRLVVNRPIVNLDGGKHKVLEFKRTETFVTPKGIRYLNKILSK
jgi:phage antirepressor YoqD-like protein